MTAIERETETWAKPNIHWAIRWGIGVLVGLVLWFGHIPTMSQPMEHGAALIVAAIFWWLLGAAQQGVVGILFVVLVVLLGVQPSSSVLQLAWTSSNMWFVFASFGFGFVISKSPLGERLTYGLLRHFSKSFWAFGVFMILAGGLLSFIGMAGDFGRMSILYPMIAVIGATAGMGGRKQGTKAMAIMVLAVGQPTTMYFYNGFWLNQTFLGFAHFSVNYVQWIADFLVPSLLVSVLALIAVRILFREDIEVPTHIASERLEQLGSLSKSEWKILGFFGLAVLLWFTSIWTGLNSGWIAMGVLALMMVPEFGVISFPEFVESINWNVVFFLTGAFALGAVVKGLKLAGIVSHAILPHTFPHNAYLFGVVVSLWSIVIHIFTGDAGSAMAVTVPVFTQSAQAFHFNPLLFGFIAYVSIVTQYFFLYQAAAAVFAYGYGMFTGKDVLKLGFASLIYTPLALGVFGVLYWQLTGILH